MSESIILMTKNTTKRGRICKIIILDYLKVTKHIY